MMKILCANRLLLLCLGHKIKKNSELKKNKKTKKTNYNECRQARTHSVASIRARLHKWSQIPSKKNIDGDEFSLLSRRDKEKKREMKEHKETTEKNEW